MALTRVAGGVKTESGQLKFPHAADGARFFSKKSPIFFIERASAFFTQAMSLQIGECSICSSEICGCGFQKLSICGCG